jgi:hypothetical protein
MSLNTKYVSIKSMLSRLFSNPLMEGITESDVARYIAEALNLIGAPLAYEDRVQEIKVKNYRADLPCELLYIQQTRKVNSSGKLEPMRYASDTFHSAYHQIGSPDFTQHSANYDWTYSLNNGVIYTNFKEGTIQQSYKAIVTDKEGLPMIPDDVKFEKAIENYIKLQWYTILWELGKISDKVFNKVEQEYSWYVGAANTRAQLQTIDEAETFRGAVTKLLDNSTAARDFFQSHGRQEFIKYGSI